MSSTSTYSYIGFLCNHGINANPSIDEFIPIPDHLRSFLNKYWNEGRFIGEGTRTPGSTEGSFKSVSFKILNQTPAQRIEQVTLKPLTSDPMWQKKS